MPKKFPYSWSLLKAFNHFHVRAALGRYPWYMRFYEPDHPADGLAVTAGIMLEFVETARQRGQEPVLTIIPYGPDLVYFLKKGIWSYQNLLDLMAQKGVDVFNFGPGIIERLNGEDPCSLFNICENHYNEKGNVILSEVAFELLQSRNLVPE